MPMPIAAKIFNYKHVLHDFNIDDFKSKPPDRTCESSPFIYNLAGHVITGDFKLSTTPLYEMCFPKGLNP